MDGGPNSTELKRELDWLLDDAIAEVKLNSDGEWRETTWMKLNSQLADSDSSMEVKTRVSLHALRELWELRIKRRMPFQYIVGSSHWRDDVLMVAPGVLCPRPETEILIDMAMEAIAKNPGLAHGTWADLGTGSGAIAIGLARILAPDASIFAVDASPAAVEIARINTQRCRVDEMVVVIEGDGDSWYGALEAHMGQLAGVVSNPPYIAASTIARLQAEVRDHEPLMALDGGGLDGMKDLQDIVGGAASALQPGGFIALETGGGDQPTIVSKLLSECGMFVDIKVVHDYAGIPRHVSAIRSAT
mmetsp:Transcript_36663/g.69006  ORF Transcript_36663/g.69006 Transcript_36663/m.69006 type:complete len:303 (-) Transcript_36663:261-1169(-)